MIFLSTLSLRRATVGDVMGKALAEISIHALLAESDALAMAAQSPDTHFYPRSPCGERLRWQWLHSLPIRISIHALLAESDSMILGQYCESTDFYPRSPCGERQRAGATDRTGSNISIHALLAESDPASRTL